MIRVLVADDHPIVRSGIVALLALADDITVVGETGASGYLLKAAPQDEIVEGVRSVAGGQTVLAPSIAATLVQRLRTDATAPRRLSPRELEVLRRVAGGHSNPDIARSLFIGEATVKTHLAHVFEKLGVSDRTRAVTRAMELGLLED